jgi:peptidoglycan/LPS O-acetylase OafA/YrhL
MVRHTAWKRDLPFAGFHKKVNVNPKVRVPPVPRCQQSGNSLQSAVCDQQEEQRPRYRAFGAFRFLLATMVLAQHGLVLLPPHGRTAFYDLELGAVAVAVFFALSGFIVCEALASFYAGRPGAFLANRALRVVPPYLAALALTVAADSALYARGHLVPLDAPLAGAPWQPRVLLAAILEIVPGLPAHRIGAQDFSFIPFAWTLRVEFAFYLVAFLATWCLARRGFRHRRLTFGVGLFAAGYALFGVFLWRHWLYGPAGGGLQLLNVPFFILGAGIFLARRDPGRLTHANLVLAVICVPAAFILCGERGHPVLALQLPLLAVLFTGLVVLSGTPSPTGAWRGWDKRLGELSYPLYIGHGVVLTVFASVWERRGAVPYLLALAGALGLAGVLHAVVEAPLRRVRDRVRGVGVEGRLLF